jgi:hypothetical protein
VSADACAFYVTGPVSHDEMRRRGERLASFYANLGLTRVSLSGRFGVLARHDVRLDGQFVWGEPLPANLRVLRAEDRALRAILGTTAVFAWDDASWRIASAPGGPTTLYAADRDGVRAYATHAVAAAIMAGLPLRVDAAAIPEFIAFDFVGGERTLIDGVRAVGSAMVIDDRGERSYWPAAERWEAKPPGDPDSILIESLCDRVGNRSVALPLTGGLDSRVIAAALGDVHAEMRAFTWGHPDWPDAVGAREAAAALGIEHECIDTVLATGDECLRSLDREARWSDGVSALAASARVWPDRGEVIASGMGGEIGRAFYYNAWSALLTPHPSADRLVRQLGARGRLHGANEKAQLAAEGSVRGWVEEAAASGARDWRLLDVLYAEQRVRRWGRSQLPLVAHDFVPVFATPQVARSLAAQSLEDRLSDRFQRRFLSTFGLPVPEPEALPLLGPYALGARRLRYRLARPAVTVPEDPVDPFIPWIWEPRRDAADWLIEEVLTHPLITSSLGTGWARATGHAFREGRARASERALRAAGPVALAKAFTDLERHRSIDRATVH